MARTQAKDYQLKRNALLKASARLFAHDGFDRTSMAEVARAGGVSKALLYHYYSGKEALLFDIVTGHLNALIDVVSGAADPDLAPRLRLESMVAALLEEFREASDAHQIQLENLASLPSQKQIIVKDLSREVVSLIGEVLAELLPDLAKDRDQMMPVTMSLFGMLNWHHTWFREEGSLDRAEYARLATTLIVDGAANLMVSEKLMDLA